MTKMMKMTKYERIFLDMEITKYSVDITGYHFYYFVILIKNGGNTIADTSAVYNSEYPIQSYFVFIVYAIKSVL